MSDLFGFGFISLLNIYAIELIFEFKEKRLRFLAYFYLSGANFLITKLASQHSYSQGLVFGGFISTFLSSSICLITLLDRSENCPQKRQCE